MKERIFTPTPYSYSSAVKAGDFVFLGLHRGGGDNFKAQLESTLEGIKKTLLKYDMGLENLVKVNVWLKNIGDLPQMEKLFYMHFPPENYPARMTATTEFIDMDCLIMIEGTAY